MILRKELCALMAVLHAKWISCVVGGCSAILRCRWSDSKLCEAPVIYTNVQRILSQYAPGIQLSVTSEAGDVTDLTTQMYSLKAESHLAPQTSMYRPFVSFWPVNLCASLLHSDTDSLLVDQRTNIPRSCHLACTVGPSASSVTFFLGQNPTRCYIQHYKCGAYKLQRTEYS